MEVLGGAARRGPYGIAVRRRASLVRLARRQHQSPRSTWRPATPHIVEPPTPSQGARRVWSDCQGRHLGQRMEQRQRLGARSRATATGNVEAAGRTAALLCGLCRRQGQGLADRFLGQCHRALRSRKREFIVFPGDKAGRQCAADGRHVRARPGRRIRHRPGRDDSGDRARRSISVQSPASSRP